MSPLGYQSAAKSLQPGFCDSTSLFFFSLCQPLISFFAGNCSFYVRELLKVHEPIASVFCGEISTMIVFVLPSPLIKKRCHPGVQRTA